MKSLKVISAIEIILMVCSTIINILGYTDKISMSYVRISFLIVILCGMIINFLIVKEQRKNLKKSKPENKNVLLLLLVLIIGTSWIVSYGFAIFSK
ncbi:hypothetical protein [Clostridium sp. 1001271B_151109_B4]|uniref:hypothetical protein n=1 Tax=Clostridium sp. 1001271B_151109_B4 TaxID=2787148 RepID=UPI0018A9D6B7|nr:hypothetical protein [Clostridium sp. 1001271B_151109_B4]